MLNRLRAGWEITNPLHPVAWGEEVEVKVATGIVRKRSGVVWVGWGVWVGVYAGFELRVKRHGSGGGEKGTGQNNVHANVRISEWRTCATLVCAGREMEMRKVWVVCYGYV